MITKTIIQDVKNPKKNTLVLPANSPYALKLVFKNGEEDVEIQNLRIVPLKIDYSPVVDESNVWTNVPSIDDEMADKSIFGTDVEGSVTKTKDNEVVISCIPHAQGKHLFKMYFAPNYSTPATTDKFYEILFEVKYTPLCELNPENGGITISGEYEDGSTFNYYIDAVKEV